MQILLKHTFILYRRSNRFTFTTNIFPLLTGLQCKNAASIHSIILNASQFTVCSAIMHSTNYDWLHIIPTGRSVNHSDRFTVTIYETSLYIILCDPFNLFNHHHPHLTHRAIVQCQLPTNLSLFIHPLKHMVTIFSFLNSQKNNTISLKASYDWNKSTKQMQFPFLLPCILLLICPLSIHQSTKQNS